jgi:hypothetical protein
MSTDKQRPQAPVQQAPVQEPESGDMLDRQYHKIGIAAVAAACRYAHDPVQPPADHDEADKAR